MSFLTVYAIGFAVALPVFATLEFRRNQRKYPSLARDDRASDTIYGICIGIMQALFWPIVCMMLALDWIIGNEGSSTN